MNPNFFIMKKLLIVFTLAPVLMHGQVKSGTTYSEHPALTVVDNMNAAFCKGDLETYQTYFDPNVKIWSVGDREPHGLDRDVQISTWWNENFTLSITRAEGANPDVIKYKKNKNGVWVMDWTEFTAINKTSGDTVSTWFHDEYFVNNDNKITMWFSYYNSNDFGAQIQNSFGAHRNGRVYDEHPHITKMEAVVKGWVDGNADEMASYFADDAKFFRLGEGEGYIGISLEERKAQWSAGIAGTSNRIMEVYGYPDAIRYEKGEGGWEVLSWWNYTNVNAETGEESKGFMHASHSFNSEGKISREVLWFD